MISPEPATGWRFEMAMPSALVTNVEVWAESIDQPTTRRLHASSTTQQYTLPSRVGCSVMSVTHSWSGSGRAKFRSTRSRAVGPPVAFRRRRLPGSPWIPARAMSIVMAW